MAHWLFNILRGFFDAHGYLTVFVSLLLENSGIPVPGETILLFASFLAFDEQQLHLGNIIAVGVTAATIGDTVGYLVGYRGGRRLLDRYRHIFHISESTVAKGEALFAKHGAVTIFFARFI